MSRYRKERDSMGELAVPADARWGAQTQRAINNFPVSGLPLPSAFICAVALIKYCAARVNASLGLLEQDVANAIQRAAAEVRDGQWTEQFPVDVFQTGSGTSTNMNVNEVLAHLASDYCGKSVSANDHVNMGQSSNDVIPSAIHISAVLAVKGHLLPALHHLQKVIGGRAAEFTAVAKTGRTHLMDAMPLTLHQELSAWEAQLRLSEHRFAESLDRLLQLAQGGTAVGTGINAPRGFADQFCGELQAVTGMAFRPADNPFAAIASQDTAAELSGQLRVLATALLKISNDLRWMNSGPLAGLGEISLPALQPGSSIMPGKVNPVIPESVAMVCVQVTGNDATVIAAAQSGNFQLNVMLPVIAYNLLQSIELLGNASRLLADRAIAGFSINEDALSRALALNPILVTALNPVVGYLKAAEIAKRAYAEKRPVLEIAEEMTDLSREDLQVILDPLRLTEGGLTDR